MTTLRDRLDSLADEAPATLPDADLWRRGQRYTRVRRTGTVVIAGVAVLVLLALGSVTWVRAAPPARPVPAGAPLGLPDRFYDPSPWLPGTAEDGPAGPVVALVPAKRGSWAGEQDGVVAVSAASGAYRFLDLPDGYLEHGRSPALSPDGRHVAFWYGDDSRTSRLRDVPFIAGYAVYDTSTGEVARHPVPSARGLLPARLAWVDDVRMVAQYSEVVDENFSTDGGIEVWTPGTEPERLPDNLTAWTGMNGLGGTAVFLRDSGQVVRFLLPGPGVEFRSLRFRGQGNLRPELDAAGKRFASVGDLDPDTDSTPNTLVMGSTADARHVELVPGSDRSWEVLGWEGDALIVLQQLYAVDGFDQHLGLVRLDVRTGQRTTVSDLSDLPGLPKLAGELVHLPTVPGERPPTPVDPRVTSGLGAATVVLGLGALLLWRRRVRP